MEPPTREEFEALQREVDAAKASMQREARLARDAKQKAQIAKQKEQIAVERAWDAEQQVRLTAQWVRDTEQQVQLLAKLKSGTYYSTIDNVWSAMPQAVLPEDNYFQCLIRKKAPLFLERTAPGEIEACAYQKTMHYANLSTTSPAVPATISTGSSENNESLDDMEISRQALLDDLKIKRALWPVDVLNIRSSGPIADLIPDSLTNASMYSDVARWIFGMDSDRGNRVVLQKAIHGSKEGGPDNPRVPATGARHFVANKIKLREQATHYDLNPRLFIVPVMTEQQMKDWKGEAYDAIVLAGDFDDFSASTVYVEIGMTSDGDLATPEQINTARKALKAVVLGLHYSIRHRRRIVDSDLVGQKESLEALKQLRQRIDQSNEAIVPGGIPLTGISNEIRVRLIWFGSHSDISKHPAPDPMLLCVKAAINWSWRNNQQLLAAGEQPDTEEDHDDFLDDSEQNEESDDESLDFEPEEYVDSHV
jgi:hypothetical protein